MKKNIFLLFLLTSFATMFGQSANVYIADANGAPVTCPENGLKLTNASTLVESLFTITDGHAFVYGLTAGDTYNYSALPPACFTNQTPSTGSFVLTPVVDFVRPDIDLTPFVGSETNTVILTVTTDGVITNVPGQVAKLVQVGSGGSFVDLTGTNNNDGTWTFSNVPFGNWNVQVDNPCIETKRSGYNSSDGPITVGCPVTSAVTYTFNVNTTEEPFGPLSLSTGEGFQIPITDCDANYPMQISGGNKIVDDTEYSISYTVDGVDYVAVATSYPTFNSPPQNSNNHNRIDFIPQGTPGLECTVNSLTTIGGTCPVIVADISKTILGPPLGNVYVTATGGGMFDPNPIVSGTLKNVDTNESIIGADNFGSFAFTNVPQGTYIATLQLTDCKEDKVINDIVVDCAGIAAGFIPYSFNINTVPSLPSSDVYFTLSDGSLLGGLVSGAKIAITSSGCSDYSETLISDNILAVNFTAVPLGTVSYTITKDCYPTLTGNFELTADGHEFYEVYLPIATDGNVFFNLNDGNPISVLVSGAEITLTSTVCSSYNQTLVSDGINATNFTDVPEGMVNYTITKNCYPTLVGSFEVTSVEYDFNAVYKLAETSDNVYFSLSDGAPIEKLVSGAEITLTSAICSSYSQVLISDSENAVNFTGVPQGVVNYTITKSCFPTLAGSFVVTAEGYEFSEVYTLSTTNTLTISVDDGALPVFGANVRVYTDDFSYDQTQYGVADFATFEDVPFGTVNYTVSGVSCFDVKEGTTTVNCNNDEPNAVFVSLTAATTGDLQISVTDGSSDIFGAQIHVYNADLTYDETKESSGYNFFANVPYGEVTYVVSQEGKKTVTETVTIECQPDNYTSVLVVLEPALGVSVIDGSLALNAYTYPNPFTNDFTINVVSKSQDKMQFKVYDMIGRLVEHRDVEVSDLQKTKFGNNYEAGIYNVVLSQGDYIKTLRVVKK